jgi:two-component system, sensor histidine kinase RegB
LSNISNKMKNIISQSANRKNLLQLILLRSIAIIAQGFTIWLAMSFFKIDLPKGNMLLVLAALLLFNCFSFYLYKSGKIISDWALFFELIIDVFALSLQLYFSGGTSNPFTSLFLLQVTIAAILLRPIFAWIITFFTILFYVILGFYRVEIHGISHHIHEGDFFNLHLQGMLISYVIAAILLVIFITKISKNLRERDLKLLQQGDILRSAMLATAAAHDLGTPLSTISVILNDWKKVDLKNSELTHDIEIIENQIERCKKSLSGILSESGNERLESAKKGDL